MLDCLRSTGLYAFLLEVRGGHRGSYPVPMQCLLRIRNEDPLRLDLCVADTYVGIHALFSRVLHWRVTKDGTQHRFQTLRTHFVL